MNVITKSPDRFINCISVSPDASLICIGANCGYRVFVLNNLNKNIFKTCINIDYKDVYIAEVLNIRSRLTGIVTRSFPSKLYMDPMLMEINSEPELCQEFSYPEKILTVKSIYDYFVTCMENSIYIHNPKDMVVLHTISLDFPNFAGLFSLSDNCVSYPQEGMVKTLLFNNMNPGQSINAHKSPIVAMILTKKGNLIATASERGATIRLFDTILGTKLKEFCYGTRGDLIYNLSFSADNKYIICSTNGETVPVFEIGSTELPASGGEIAEESPFATATLPIIGQKTISALKDLEVIVVSFEEVVYCYTFDPLKGGACRPSRRFLLNGSVKEFVRRIEDDETLEGFLYVRKPKNEAKEKLIG